MPRWYTRPHLSAADGSGGGLDNRSTLHPRDRPEPGGRTEPKERRHRGQPGFPLYQLLAIRRGRSTGPPKVLDGLLLIRLGQSQDNGITKGVLCTTKFVWTYPRLP